MHRIGEIFIKNRNRISCFFVCIREISGMQGWVNQFVNIIGTCFTEVVTWVVDEVLCIIWTDEFVTRNRELTEIGRSRWQIVWTEWSQSIYNLTAFIRKTNSHSYANGMSHVACARIHAYQNPKHIYSNIYRMKVFVGPLHLADLLESRWRAGHGA